MENTLFLCGNVLHYNINYKYVHTQTIQLLTPKKYFVAIKKHIYLCGGEHRVLIKAEHSVSGDGVVGQETAAYHLEWY